MEQAISGSETNKASLSEWKSYTGQDAHSLSVDPVFANPGGTTATDYRPDVTLNGTTIGTVITDYSGTARTSVPTIGAWERILINKWKGTLSDDWNTAGNWTGKTIPAMDANIIFDDNPVNHCKMDQNRSVNHIFNSQPTYRILTNGYKLIVKGDLIFSNNASDKCISKGFCH